MRDFDLWRDSSEAEKAEAERACGGEVTEEDMELARVFSNMALDVARGDKAEAKRYVHKITAISPALERLMGRVGMAIAKAETAVKQ